MKPLILASASPRRKELLTQIGLKFQVTPSSVTEEWEPHMEPMKIARKLAMEKAADVAAGLSSGIVIGADTVVVLGQQLMGKPRDAEEAFKILSRLSGKAHQVITAVAIIDSSSHETILFDATTLVFFREIADQEIKAYIASGEPMDKAGAYGIQGKGILFVQRIEGCYTNVVGLPLPELSQQLSRLGIRTF